MHNLAIELSKQGYWVTGSDDEIFNPSKTRLEKQGLLPEKYGWFPEKITSETSTVILGMHARIDNPELKKASELGIKIYSFPEFMYEKSTDKKRIVIAGSHGKTTITSMIIHVLNSQGYKTDHLVGAKVPGIDSMVKLTDEAPVIIFEGDEYLTSTLDRTPKFLRYHHDIGLISGIAWDHINVFKTEEDYIKQFERFIKNTPRDGYLIYNALDLKLKNLVNQFNPGISIPYTSEPYTSQKGITSLDTDSGKVPLKVFGQHNMQNLSGAWEVLKLLGISKAQFYESIQSFVGANNRLEVLIDNEKIAAFKDFAHAPSKVKATLNAVREKFPDRKIVAISELHTYSSLNRKFIENYKGTLDQADLACIFLDNHALSIKKMDNIDDKTLKTSFGCNNLVVLRTPNQLIEIIDRERIIDRVVFLFMSSGKFGGVNLESIFVLQ